MSYAHLVDGAWVEFDGTYTIDGEPQSDSWLATTSAEDLAEEGIYFVNDDPDTPIGRRGSRQIISKEDRPYWRYEILPEIDNQVVLTRRQDIDYYTSLAFGLGFTPSHPKFVGERLQLRDERDRSSWLTAKLEYADQVADGHGDVERAKFRTMANTTIFVTFSEALLILRELTAWAFVITEHNWALKDAEERGDAFDPSVGWPEVLPPRISQS